MLRIFIQMTFISFRCIDFGSSYIDIVHMRATEWRWFWSSPWNTIFWGCWIPLLSYNFARSRANTQSREPMPPGERGERGRHQNPFIHQPLGPTNLRNRQPCRRTPRAPGSQARRAGVQWLTRDQQAHRPLCLRTMRTQCYSNWLRSQVRKNRFSARWAIMVQKWP